MAFEKLYNAKEEMERVWKICKKYMEGLEHTKHPRHVENYSGSLEDLPKEVGKMQYDLVAEFIELFGDDIKRQADNDQANGKKQLARRLYSSAEKLYESKQQICS